MVDLWDRCKYFREIASGEVAMVEGVDACKKAPEEEDWSKQLWHDGEPTSRRTRR